MFFIYQYQVLLFRGCIYDAGIILIVQEIPQEHIVL